MRVTEWLPSLVCALVVAGAAHAADAGASSGPAVGVPSRAADLDVLPGFRTPPPGYGEVAFYWWIGDPLTKERLTWQLDRLARKGVQGLQVNYAHSDRGGTSYGLTYPSEPKLFTEEWWDLYGWFLREAKERGMATSLSDYTLGVGQGWTVDEAIAEHPEIQGAVLEHAVRDVEGGASLEWELPLAPVCVRAYPRAGEAITEGEGIDLLPFVSERRLAWQAPAGAWRVVGVWPQPVRPSINPMDPGAGPAIVEHFFQPFEERNPGEGGKGLNFFFSDELGFRVRGWLWDERFAEEFRARKGYDVVPELPSLFLDTGPRTPKVRLDVSDVIVALSEKHYFEPVFDWHERRGMVYGCDHGGRGYDLTEFGDYFRTQRWNQGPGCDQPGLARDVVKNKVASSIAHLYERPRVWIEGYHSSGWGTSSGAVADATFANFAMGQNLLTLHGLYYSTHGGWWEWAPPCNHWRMPYWAHMGTLLGCTERLSYLLSQGTHVCDVAVLYPVAALEAGIDGGQAAETAFDLGRRLYAAGTDFDYMDFESLDRAEIRDGRLDVAGESYRVVMLPAMKAVRHSTLTKLAAFARGGGIVIAVGALPEVTDRAGRDDPEVARLVLETFGIAADEMEGLFGPRVRWREGGGQACAAPSTAAALPLVQSAFAPDIAVEAEAGSWQFLHRRAGPRDIYALYGLAKGTECTLRATGRAELWDPWTGATRPLPVLGQDATSTRLRLPGEREDMQLIVFSPGTPDVDDGAPPPLETIVPLATEWECEPVPTLDNRWGDFRWPPTKTWIGPEARWFRYREETSPGPGWERPDLDDSQWTRASCDYGPMFEKLGPLPADGDVAGLEARLVESGDGPVEVAGRQYQWSPYEFSWRSGVEGDPGHQGYHGLKEQTYAEFLRLGKLVDRHTSYVREAEEGGRRYYLRTNVLAPRDMTARTVAGGMAPAAVWVRGVRVGAGSDTVLLREGPNPLLLRYDQPGVAYFVFVEPTSPLAGQATDPTAFSPAARWMWSPEGGALSRCAFRKEFALTELPREARVHITCDNGYTLFVNGQQVGSGSSWTTVQSYEVSTLLRAGANAIAVLATNDGGQAGLIAELVLPRPAATDRMGTDATWLCSAQPAGAWQGAGYEGTGWQPAAEIAPFVGSLWYEHEQGPPRLEAEPSGALAPTVGSLVTPWWGQEGILPFDVAGERAPTAGWYRCAAPPGARAWTVTALGTVRAWLDGAEVRGERLVDAGPRPGEHGPGQPAPVVYRFRIAEPTRSGGVLALRVEHPAGCYGGTVLPEPVAFECGPGVLGAGDWSQRGGLECYSGGMWYRQTVRVSKEQLAGAVVLDLGSVVASAEVRVNGEPAGVRVAPPWRWDVTDLLRPGDNRLEVLVYNTLANHYRTIPTRYGGSPVSGLLGPAVLRVTE